MNRKREAGFTLVEVMVAIAILSFAIFATLRVITASLNSIARQGQRVKVFHLAQAHLVELETKSFSLIVPENWVINSSAASYRLDIYNPNVSPSEIFISSDDDYWYDSDGLGFSPNDGNDDGILVVENEEGTVTVFTRKEPSPTFSTEYSWDQNNLTLTFLDAEGKEIQIYYRYYHLIKEGGTIPLSDGEELGEELGEGLKERTIKLITSVGNTDGIGTAEEKSYIMGDDLSSGAPLSSSDYDSFNSQTKELTFIKDKEGKSVYIYYLSKKGADIDGDGCKDPLDDAILGVVEGNFYNPDGSIASQITNTKKVTVTEYWKQGENIQSTRQEAYINR